jgi:hypothetical protein
MVLDDSPFTVLAQQGAGASNLVVVEKSTGVPQREPSVGDNDRARRVRSEVASSASPNHRMFEHDARRCITQNHAGRECDRDQDDLRNVIEDWRRSRTRTPSPPQQYLAEDIAPVGKGGFRALEGPLR